VLTVIFLFAETPAIAGLGQNNSRNNSATSVVSAQSPSSTPASQSAPSEQLGICRAYTCIDVVADREKKIKRMCDTTPAATTNGVSVQHFCGPGYYCHKETKYCEKMSMEKLSCTYDEQCYTGMKCVNKVCLFSRLPGDGCKDSDDCLYHNGECRKNVCVGEFSGSACVLEAKRTSRARLSGMDIAFYDGKHTSTCDQGLVCIPTNVSSTNDVRPQVSNATRNDATQASKKEVGNQASEAGVCTPMLFPPQRCIPTAQAEGICAPGVSRCMESKIGLGNFEVLFRISRYSVYLLSSTTTLYKY
jgi:hypothetical protein